jgi:branched-chain amino acid transport system ATP-binding protein
VEQESATDVPTVLELCDLTAGYGELAAIRDVSLHIRAGEVVALFGPNGAGKSTTLLAAVGAIPRMAGHVNWCGKQTELPLHRLFRAGLAYVPEDRSVTPGLSVKDNLLLGPGGVDGALSYFPELKLLLPRPAGLLSGGEQKMLVLARALACKPKAILADEISLGLAPLIVERLLAALREAAIADGFSVLLVEQQVRRAMAVADRWYLLSGGRIRAKGDRTAGIAEIEEAYFGEAVDKASTPEPLSPGNG